MIEKKSKRIEDNGLITVYISFSSNWIETRHW